MEKLSIDGLWRLEEYAERRPAFRKQVLAHKKLRQVALGPNLTLQFEDRMLMQYQVQEMLRIERVFEKAGIQEELDAYNPLIPDGSNWKATCLIEFEDVEERRSALKALRGIEDQIWVSIGNTDRVLAVADEDMERSNEDKTSAVHFLRFELGDEAVTALRTGAVLTIGSAHAQYLHQTVPSAATVASLLQDLV